MGNFWMMLIVGIGVGTWTGKQFYRRTGGNLNKSAVAGSIAGFTSALLALSILLALG